MFYRFFEFIFQSKNVHKHGNLLCGMDTNGLSYDLARKNVSCSVAGRL